MISSNVIAVIVAVTNGEGHTTAIRQPFTTNPLYLFLEDGIPKPVISGGEEDLANLVLRLAISQMIAERAGQSFSLLVLDEIFGSLDDTRRQNVVELLRGLQDRFEQVILVHGVRQVEELAYEDLITNQLPNHEFLGEIISQQLKYYPTVTREAYRNQGRVTDLIENGKLFADLGVPALNPAEDRVMICGSPEMLRDLKNMMEARGFEEGNTSTPGDFVIERAFAEQ